MVFTFLEKLIQPMDSLIKLGSEYIVDKDKVIEFQFKAMELRQQQAVSLLATKTHPFVDALVKLMYAFQIFWRPMVATFMTGFGAYAHYKGIDMDVALHAIFDGAFPAWGASRHVHKNREIEIKAKVPQYEEWHDG